MAHEPIPYALCTLAGLNKKMVATRPAVYGIAFCIIALGMIMMLIFRSAGYDDWTSVGFTLSIEVLMFIVVAVAYVLYNKRTRAQASTTTSVSSEPFIP